MAKMDRSKSLSESETDLLMASTDTLVIKKGLPEEIKHDIRKFSKFVWNPEKEYFLKRSDKDWARILLFYFCFFAGLAAFTAVTFALYLEVYIDKNHPRWQGKETLLLGWPSLGLRPMPDFHTTMIRFEQGRAHSYKPFSDHIQAVLDQYENQAQESEAFIDCTNLAEKDRNKGKACRFQIDSLGKNCTWQRDYGYDDGKPCILLKLTKIFGWEPELYDSTDAPPQLSGRFSSEHIGVSCEGENPIDEENMGPLVYFPPEGFPRYYYPYLNQEGYRAPLVMVQFVRPTNGIVINVWCKAWARNIKHHRYDNMGSIHFEMLID